jgi:hypothetical protein
MARVVVETHFFFFLQKVAPLTATPGRWEPSRGHEFDEKEERIRKITR